MTITITRALSQEEEDALTSAVAHANEARPGGSPSYTIQSFLEHEVNQRIAIAVEDAYQAALKRMGELAADLPYSTRLGLMDQIAAAAGN